MNGCLALGLTLMLASSVAARPAPTPDSTPKPTPPAPSVPYPSNTPPAPPTPTNQPPSLPEGILATGASVETIATGHRFTEGPVWTSVPGGGRLLYSDIPQDAVFEWTPKEPATDKPGPGSQLVKPSGNSNGLIIGPDNVVIAAAHAGRLAIVFPADKARTLVDKHDGKSLNSPNDLCAGPDGSIYFTDPPYGLRGSLGPAGGRTRELDFCGVYRLAPDGALTLLNKSLRTPNGLAFSPDDKTLYVADTSGGKIHAFDVKPDGSLGEARVFAEVMNGKTGKSGGPDGVKVDASGHVLCAAGDGIHMFDASGKHLGTIATPKGATNLCFGGEKNDWLFITASSDVYRVQMATPGRKLQTPKIPPFK